MSSDSPHTFLCNGAELANSRWSADAGTTHRLEYRQVGNEEPNVRVSLQRFFPDVTYLPDRILDLLELAAYVYAADRLASRGSRDAVEYHSWARSMRFVVRVRDAEFWTDSDAAEMLRRAMVFMTGDRSYEFEFQAGHDTPQATLFDRADCCVRPEGTYGVLPFSGGLDSLAGAVQRLRTSGERLCLVSHQSQTGTAGVQKRLVSKLAELFPDRVLHYRFRCNLAGVEAREETQRTRALLYTAVAFAIADTTHAESIDVYENGLTALNFGRRQDMLNARASRTVHPKTMALLERFYACFRTPPIRILRPFQWLTKSEVLDTLRRHGGTDLLTDAVSCSQTRHSHGLATHCGLCSQCVDRRFAAYAAGLDDVDEGGIYSTNFCTQSIVEPGAKTLVLTYVQQALAFSNWNISRFEEEHLSELDHVWPHVELPEQDAIQEVYDLCRRHGNQVVKALRRMYAVHDDLTRPVPSGSLLALVNEREYLREPVERLAVAVAGRLQRALPLAFQRVQPTNENDLNDKISAILEDGRAAWEREYPTVRISITSVRADHSQPESGLWVETKYIRGKTTPSRVTDQIAADCAKYPPECFLLFIVYDPERRIVDDDEIRHPWEAQRPCHLRVIR